MSSASVVTGIGVVAPNGFGTEEYWRATCAGENGIGPVQRFDASDYPATLAGEVPNFEAHQHLPGKLLPQTDHMTRLALVAADWALADAEVDEDAASPLEMGVITASSAGGFEFGQRELQHLWRDGSEYVSAYQSFAWFYAVNTGQISIRNGLKGPSGVLVTDHAGALDALAQARRHLRKRTKLVVSGGVDGSICPWGWAAHQSTGRLSPGTDPATAYLPFDSRAQGHVAAEGGAILIMENADAARARGAHSYGEIAGYAATFDPRPGTGRTPTLTRAIRNALADAKVQPDEIDVVFADAAGIPELDALEADAIEEVFGANAVPVSIPKTMTGRLFAGGAAVDIAAALLSIRDGVIPPTANVRVAPNYALDLTTDGLRRTTVRAALVLARGHGGFNSALVVRATEDTDKER